MNRVELRYGEVGGESRRWIQIVVGLVVLVHFGILLIFFEPAISTPDAHGYFAQARLLAEHGTSFLQPESTVQYRGPHWYQFAENRYATTFPPGFPILLAMIYWFSGPTAALLVSPLLTSLALLGLFFVCREWVGETWALAATLVMATNPYVNEHALFGDSHAALDFFFIWSLVFMAAWTRTNSGLWGLFTGLFAGVIPTIRYPEVVLCMGILGWGLFQFQRRRMSWHSLLLAGLGAALPLGTLLLRNQLLFGRFWRTGYTFLDEPALFGWGHFKAHFLPYVFSLMVEANGLIFVLGVAGIVFLLSRCETRAYGVLLAGLTFPLATVYMAYFFPPDPQSMRYLLPTLFVYTIAAVWLLKCVVPNRSPWMAAAPVILCFVSCAWGLPRSIFAISHLKECNAVLAEITNTVGVHVEKGSVLITGEAVNQNLDFFGWWRLVDGKLFDFGPDAGNPERLLKPGEPSPTSTDSSGKDRFDVAAREVWHWAEPHYRVYVLGDSRQVARLRAQILVGGELRPVEQVHVPDWRSRHSRPRTHRSEDHPLAPGSPPGPMGPDRIFDLVLHGQDLMLMEWKTNSQASLSAVP